MGDSMGLVSSLMGGQMSGDSTTIPLQIRAIMAKRAAEKKDNTPMWTKEDALDAINKGFKGMSQAQRDSISNKFDHKAYVEHLDQLGMQVVPKPTTQNPLK